MAESFFAAAWAAASSNIDVFFGEDFSFSPMTHLGGRYGPDPDRQFVARLKAALDESAVFSDPIGQRNASGMSKGIVSQSATTQANIDIASDALPFQPRDKDRMTRLRDGAVFEITGVLNDSFARITLRVQYIGGGS